MVELTVSLSTCADHAIAGRYALADAAILVVHNVLDASMAISRPLAWASALLDAMLDTRSLPSARLASRRRA